MPQPEETPSYRPLAEPPDVATSTQSVELLRAWLLDGRLNCVLLPTVWKETPGAWGLLLADVVAHLANALSEETGLSRQELHSRIRLALLAELERPTDTPSGAFLA